MFPFQVGIHSWHLNSLSWVRAKANCPSTSNLQMWVKMPHPPSSSHTHTNSRVCGWQSREELPPLSECTTEPECGPVRKSRHFQIYCWINWQHWERLTGHSSWRALAQWRVWTGLLRFDFLSWPPWRMSYGEGGGDTASHDQEASPLCPPVQPHSLLLPGPSGAMEVEVVESWSWKVTGDLTPSVVSCH